MNISIHKQDHYLQFIVGPVTLIVKPTELSKDIESISQFIKMIMGNHVESDFFEDNLDSIVESLPVFEELLGVSSGMNYIMNAKLSGDGKIYFDKYEVTKGHLDIKKLMNVFNTLEEFIAAGRPKDFYKKKDITKEYNRPYDIKDLSGINHKDVKESPDEEDDFIFKDGDTLIVTVNEHQTIAGLKQMIVSSGYNPPTGISLEKIFGKYLSNASVNRVIVDAINGELPKDLIIQFRSIAVDQRIDQVMGEDE